MGGDREASVEASASPELAALIFFCPSPWPGSFENLLWCEESRPSLMGRVGGERQTEQLRLSQRGTGAEAALPRMPFLRLHPDLPSPNPNPNPSALSGHACAWAPP